MIEKFLNYRKCVPNKYYKTVYDIDFKKLYNAGKRVLFFDLDNTLMSYKETEADFKLKSFIKNLESMGFEVMIVSNNHKKRVEHVAKALDLKYIANSLKPLKIAFKRAKRKLSKDYLNSEIVEIGDQLLTDVYGSRGLKIYTILVKPIDNKTEITLTKINRSREKKLIEKIKRKDIRLFNKKLKDYERDKHEKNNL